MKKRDKEVNEVESGKAKKTLPLILISLVLAIVVFYSLMQVEKNKLADYETEVVVVAKEQLPETTEITEENVEKYFKEVEVNKNMVLDHGYASLEEVVEMKSAYTTFELMKNEQLTSNKIVKTVDRIGIENPVEVGFKVSSFDCSVGGTLRKGDLIDVVVIDKTTGEEKEILKDVMISEALDSSGVVVDKSDTETPTVAFNILIRKEQKDEFNHQIGTGTVRLVKKNNVQ